MAETKLTIKVGADIKTASQQLKALGYNVENIQTKTQQASKASQAWNDVMKKSAGSVGETVSKLGPSFLAVTAAATVAYKTISSVVKEGLTINANAKEQIDKISKLWTNIKANLGSALLDSISPALDALYNSLKKISDWSTQTLSANRVNNALNSANRKNDFDFSGYSNYDIAEAYNARINKTNKTETDNWALMQMLEELNKRDYIDQTINGSYKNDRNESTSNSGAASSLDDFIKGNASSSNTYQIQQLESVLDKAYSFQNLGADIIGEENWQILQEVIESTEKKIEDLKNTTSVTASSMAKDILSVASEFGNLFSAINSLTSQASEQEIEAIENSTASEEEKAQKIDEIKRKQFNRDKANHLAQLAITTAQGIMNATTAYVGTPWMMGTMIGLISATSAVQAAQILGQSYTGLASGGIVQGPTKALIGEGAEKEAVIPLSKLEEFVSPPQKESGLVLNVTVNSNNSDVAESIYYAIERAQRSGLLPRWRYA